MRSEDETEELLETGEIEVVQTELRAAVEGVRPQTRARAEQPHGTRRTAVRKIGGGAGPVSSASGPLSVQGGPRHHSSLGASVSLGAINQALGAMNTEPAFADRDERPSSRAVVRTPAPSPVSSRVSTRLPSPTAAMPTPLPPPPPPPSPPHLRRDEEATMARPISSPPPPIARTRARQAPPAGGIAVPTPYDDIEETNAVMPLMAPPAPLGETTEEMPTAMQLQTPPTIMAGGAAMPAAFRAQVLQQMQAARAGQSPTAMDQLIAQQLVNVQRAQPIAAPEATQLSAGAVPPPMSSASALAPASPASGLAVVVPMPGAIRPPGSPHSASNVDPPGTVVTARTKVRFGNPALSWTAGLLVVGACVGAAVFVMWRNDSRAEAAAQAARSVQAAAAAQQAQMASTGTYLGQAGSAGAAPAVPAMTDPSAVTAPPAAAPYGGVPANGSVAVNTPAPSASTTAAAAALTAAALNDGTTGMGGTLAPGNGTQPVMQLTPAQLAVMTGGAPAAGVTHPASTPAPAPAPAPAAGSNNGSSSGANSGDLDGSHHHHSHAAVAANDSPAPAPRPAPAPAPIARAAAPAPAPKPAPAPTPKKSAAPAAGSDDMDSAAKALAKAQLEQSL